MLRPLARLGGLLLLGLIAPAALGAINLTPTLAQSFDGTRNTKYPAGDKPQGGDTCLSGWTCLHLGNGSSSFDDQSATAINITTTAPSGDDDGIGAVYKTFGAESDRHLEAKVDSIIGNAGNFSGGGLGMAEGLTFGTDYKSYCWWPNQGRTRFKSDVGGAGQQSQIGAVGTTIPNYIGFEYKASTNEQSCWESEDGATWEQIGVAVVNDFQSGIYFVFGTSDDGTASATTALSSIVANTTLSFVDGGGGGSGPPPHGPSDTPDYVDPTAGVTLQGGRRPVSAANAAALTLALQNALCGDDITLGVGTFATASTLNKVCPSNNPIIVRGSPNFQSVFTSSFTISGEWGTVTGIFFNGANVRANIGGQRNKFIGNKVTGFGDTTQCIVRFHLLQPGAGAEIAYNEYYSPGPWCPGNPGNQSRIVIRTAEAGGLEANVHQDVYIHRNYFHNLPAKPVVGNYDSGQSDAIELCQSGQRTWTPTSDIGAYVEYNLIDNALGADALLDYKCGGVVSRYNTVINSIGRIDLRGGWRSTLESNWVVGTGAGSTIHGAQHRVIGNNLGAGSIKLQAGDVDCLSAPTGGTGHPQVCDALIIGNVLTGKIRVGDHPGADQTIDVDGTIIEESDCADVELVAGFEVNTTNNCASATTVDYTAAEALTADEVGPDALPNAGAAYLAPRGLD